MTLKRDRSNPDLSAHRRSYRHLPLVLLIASTTGFLWWYFLKLFKCPSCYLFVDGADGLKNYFTSVYYVIADSGLWFTGMNYPYGEHIIYTDNQPFWSGLMNLAGTIIPYGGHVVGTINMLMILALLVTVICIYSLLRNMHIPVWLALCASLPIAFLSPQIARFNGHYSLAYTCFIPVFLCLMVWWCRKSHSIARGALLVAWIAIMSYTHLYFLFISVCFVSAYGFVVWVSNRFRWNRILLHPLLVVVMASAVVYLPVKLTDPVKDRPETVYGIQVYTSKPAGTFLPWYAPAEKFWIEKVKIKKPDFEALSYIGFPGLILSIFILVFVFRSVWSRWRVQRSPVMSMNVTPMRLVIASIIVWIISTGWFYLIGGSVLLEILPVLGQFRSLGRLGWMFYYGYTLFVVYYMFKVWNERRSWKVRLPLTIVFAVLMSVWYWEAWQYLNHQTQGIYHHNNTFRGKKVYLEALKNIGVNPNEFQAILQLPLVSVGSERISISRGIWSLNRTFQCAYETGLPLINSNMSRTSVSQSMELLQLISDPEIHKERLDNMNDKPLLLIADFDQLIQAERDLVKKAEHLADVQSLSLYRLPLKAFHQRTEPILEKKILAYNVFDELPGKEGFNGTGALQTTTKNQTIMEFASQITDTLYFEYWTRMTHDGVFFPAISYTWYHPDGSKGSEEVLSMHNYDPVNVMNQWVQGRIRFVTGPEKSRHVFSALESGGVFDECRVYKSIILK